MKRFLAPIAAALLLGALFLPAVDPSENRLIADFRLPVLPLVLLILLAAGELAGRRAGRKVRWAFAVLLVAAALLQAAAMLVLSFLDRGLDLYFDLGQVPSLAGLAREAAGPWRAGGAAALAGLGLALTLAATAWAVGAWADALKRRRRFAMGTLAVSFALVAAGALPRDNWVSFAATATVAEQATQLYRAAAVMNGFDRRYDSALATPAPAATGLGALNGHDVLLVFVESYGTAALDEPRWRAALAPAFAGFEADAARAGYGLVSSRLVSPVFGAGSWLAHGTLASGLKLDPFLYRLLTASKRTTLAGYFRAAGRRTVAYMPGIKKPWPEAPFWGYDRLYNGAELGYGGPEFGWFDIPDQWTLERFRGQEMRPGHAPLFAELILVSSHTPFYPVPPYVADWHGPDPYAGIAQAEWDRIYRQPDWSHLETPYLDSIAYDLRTLGNWLAELPGEPLVIVLGDHQPPGLISGASAPWTVPIYALSRDRALLTPFVAAGYGVGAMPPATAPVKGMESFLGDFLAGFSREGIGS